MHRWTQARLGSLTVTAALTLTATGAVAAAAPPGAYDRPGKTERVSVTSKGEQAKHLPAGVTANDCGGNADINANGRFVVFLSDADNLVPEKPTIPGRCDAYWHDRVTGATRRVSVASDGTQAVVRPDLRHVAVSSPSISDGSVRGVHECRTQLR